MAKADQVKALIRSHAEGDDDRFYAIALQVAAHAARLGHNAYALELRDLVDASKTDTTHAAQRRVRSTPHHGAAVPLAQPRGELASLLTVQYPNIRLNHMALAPALAQRLARVVHEQRQRELLQAHGFTPARKLLLIGPPGTGKTMTAAALATELGVPLFTIQLDGLITKFMGETAAQLRLVFEAISTTRGVYLFDEFDALGAHRNTQHDVGEIRRVLNSFLQFLEEDQSDSLLIGATNHGELLDRALFRRFDDVLEYTTPTQDIAEQVVRERLASLDTSAIDWDTVRLAAHDLSHAELTRASEQAAKNVLLKGRTTIDTPTLVAALEERAAMRW